MARSYKLNQDQRAQVERIKRGMGFLMSDLDKTTTGQIPGLARDMRDLAKRLEDIVAPVTPMTTAASGDDTR